MQADAIGERAARAGIARVATGSWPSDRGTTTGALSSSSSSQHDVHHTGMGTIGGDSLAKPPLVGPAELPPDSQGRPRVLLPPRPDAVALYEQCRREIVGPVLPSHWRHRALAPASARGLVSRGRSRKGGKSKSKGRGQDKKLSQAEPTGYGGRRAGSTGKSQAGGLMALAWRAASAAVEKEEEDDAAAVPPST